MSLPNSPIHNLNKIEYFVRPIQFFFLWIVGLLESMLIYCICTQYLVGAPFALITASIQHGMAVISLWHCWGSPGFFYSGLQLICIFWSIVSHLPPDNTHRFSMGFRSGEFAGQSIAPTPWSFNQLLVLLAVWGGAKSGWEMKSASLKSWSAEGSMKCSKISW